MCRKLKRITYVEDEPDIRAVTQIVLQTFGDFILDVCESGVEAVEKSPAFNPDLILLDVMMPGMDGIETFRRLRDNPKLSCTPIVFMTAKVQSWELEKYLDMGAAGVIEKPFDPATLTEEIMLIWNSRDQGGERLKMVG